MDKIAWDNSPQLRDAIGRELDNWASWSKQGAIASLDYPRQIAGETPPESDPPAAVDEPSALLTDRLLSSWVRWSHGPGEAGLFLLKLKYIERRPVESIAHHYNRKFRTDKHESTIAAMIDEAEWVYYLLTLDEK